MISSDHVRLYLKNNKYIGNYSLAVCDKVFSFKFFPYAIVDMRSYDTIWLAIWLVWLSAYKRWENKKIIMAILYILI